MACSGTGSATTGCITGKVLAEIDWHHRKAAKDVCEEQGNSKTPFACESERCVFFAAGVVGRPKDE